MPTHVSIAAALLRDAAVFFRSIGKQNPDLNEQMNENAGVYEEVASLLEAEPMGEIDLDE